MSSHNFKYTPNNIYRGIASSFSYTIQEYMVYTAHTHTTHTAQTNALKYTLKEKELRRVKQSVRTETEPKA